MVLFKARVKKMEWNSKYFIYDENRIHYFHSIENDKKPLILLHGAADNGLCWAPVAERLSGKYSVIMPDARGHGLTETPESSLSLDLMAKDVAMLIQNLNLRTPQLIGHSMGGK